MSDFLEPSSPYNNFASTQQHMNPHSSRVSKNSQDDYIRILQHCILTMLTTRPVYLEGFGFLFLKDSSHAQFSQNRASVQAKHGIMKTLSFEQCDDAVHISVFKEYFESSHLIRALKDSGVLESTSFLRQWLRNFMKSVKQDLSLFGISKKLSFLGDFISLNNKSIILLSHKDTYHFQEQHHYSYLRPLLTSSLELFTACYGSPLSVSTILLSEFLGDGFNGTFTLASFVNEHNDILSITSGFSHLGVEFVTESTSAHPWEPLAPGWVNEINCIAYYLIQTLSIKRLLHPIVAELPHQIGGHSHMMISERSQTLFRHVSKQGEFMLFNITGIKKEESDFGEIFSKELLLKSLIEKRIIGTWKNRKSPLVKPPKQDTIAH